jgi:hypothetical protein
LGAPRKTVQAALHSFSKDAVRVDAYLGDRKSAELTARSRGALAVLYQPRVVRSEGKDGRVFICFSLLTVEPQSSKVYPPKSPELDKATLDDLSGALTAALTRSGQKLNDPVVARLEILERQVAELAAAAFKTNALIRAPATPRSYRTSRAVAVGLDWPQEETFPRLAYAASDAASFAAKIQTLGFRTELLTGESATLSGMHKAIDAAAAATAEDDLLVIYYAGMTFRSTDVDKSASKPVLVLPTFDFRIAELANGLTLPALVARIASSARGDVLIVLDGCHGTVGLGDPGEPSIGASRTAALQVMAASQDDEFGLEISSLGGGAARVCCARNRWVSVETPSSRWCRTA